MSAVVAIVGRPNVGKSTLFNRLVGKRRAIESNIPGTTRDRLYDKTLIDDYEVLLVDTGGLELGKEGESIEASVQEQSHIAIDGADVILFVVDVREDPTAEDFHAADLLRKSKKPVLLVANKCDNPRFEEQRYNLYELGFGEPIPVTALHSFGIDELESRVGDELKDQGFERDEKAAKPHEERIRIAFLGRPNVGKSTMVNALFGKKMVVVSDVPGTTRDATEIDFEYKDFKFTLVDTAGIRRRGKIEQGIEKYSILRTMQSVDEADICVLMLGFDEGITNQDCHVSQYILEQKKGLILVVNKMDLVDPKKRDQGEHMFVHRLKTKMAYLPWAPVIFASALERRNIFQVLELSAEISEERRKTVPTKDLRVWLQLALDKHPPNMSRGKHRFTVSSVEQVSTQPPTFVFRCNWPEVMHFSYGRYLENGLRETFGFVGTALKLIFRKPGDEGKQHRKDEAAVEADDIVLTEEFAGSELPTEEELAEGEEDFFEEQ
ncbi:ribosome biogenesis GTPase Der [Candidatus Peregrinibacteria bacterium]|nr:MAG: ribosome biogenesis GTPase Der [Candidatus Peregrinibacteria bacterium]